MIVRLDQKTKQTEWEMFEFQQYALHEPIMIVLLLGSDLGLIYLC